MTARSSVSVYDGRRLIGIVTENGNGKHVASTWPDGRKLGVYGTRKEAADAISAAHGRDVRRGATS